MHDAASEALRAVDWRVVERAVARWRRRARLVWGVLGLLTVWLVTQWLAWRRGDPAHDAPVALGLGLAAVLVGAAVRWRKGRRLRLAGRSAETLALLRRDLAGRARAVRALLVAIPLYGVACLAAAAWMADGATQRILFAALGALAGALWLFLWLVKRPILARERTEFDGAVGK